MVIEPDTKVVQRHPRRQPRSQTPDLVGTLPPEPEVVEDFVVDTLADRTYPADPLPKRLGPASLFGIALGRMDLLRSVALQPAPMVVCSLEALVGHVGSREGRAHAEEPGICSGPHREKALGQGLVGGGGTAETETRYHPGRLYGGQKGEALVPSYAVGPADVGLSGQPSMPPALCVPDGHGRTIECLVGLRLTLQRLPQLHGDLLEGGGVEAHEAVELGTVREGRERSSQMGLGIAVEVPFASESRPAGEDGEGDDLALAEGGWWSRASLFGSLRLAEVVDHNVEYGEEGVHVEHEESVPFPVGSGSKPTLERGHLPLNSSTDNSHQAFKDSAGRPEYSQSRSAQKKRLRRKDSIASIFYSGLTTYERSADSGTILEECVPSSTIIDASSHHFPLDEKLCARNP